MLEILLLK